MISELFGLLKLVLIEK